MTTVTLADWRAAVEKELAGASFEKSLTYKTAEGLSLEPLYTEVPQSLALATQTPIAGASPFRICMRHTGDNVDALAADLEQGADALWLFPNDRSLEKILSRIDPANAFLVLHAEDISAKPILERIVNRSGKEAYFALAFDPLERHGKRSSNDYLARELMVLGEVAKKMADVAPRSTAAMISLIRYHNAGADAADEIAFALSTLTLYLETILAAGVPLASAAAQIAFQISVGRDTFGELCKLRALRVCVQKVFTAAGISHVPPSLVHAVCSARTTTTRDPWVNMLRATTQTFAAILGGADLVTPTAFDEALGPESMRAHRVARNTGLVLREESHLGKVIDPANGSYYLETLTDALAREGWRRFQALQKEGGIADALSSGRIAARIEESWKRELALFASRKAGILGVSEFANPGEEKLPRGNLAPYSASPHRESEAYERLVAPANSEALLITLGEFGESRARVGFAQNFFSAGGIRTRESSTDALAPIVCICGTDERYAADAAAHAKALKALGCKQVVVAGRPGTNEATLREAGVDGFIYVGCDVPATLTSLIEVLA